MNIFHKCEIVKDRVIIGKKEQLDFTGIKAIGLLPDGRKFGVLIPMPLESLDDPNFDPELIARPIVENFDATKILGL